MTRNRIYLTMLFACSWMLSIAQIPSSNQNYVVEMIVKTSEKKTASSLVGLPVDSANKSIQYIDGLGRPLQTIQWQGSPDKKDIVQFFVYDALGREATKYSLYAEQASSDGTYKTNALTNQGNYYGSASWDATGVKTPYPFSKTIFEPSPLSRIFEQGFQGLAWQPAATRTPATGRTAAISYSTNNTGTTYTTTGFAARLYVATPTDVAGSEHIRTLSSTSFYQANQLYLTTSKNENWISADGKAGITEEYKDKEGRVVLKRIFNKTGSTAIETLSTYYVYDDYGNLSFVLPPGANPDAGGITQTTLDNLCYQYRYDGRRRLIEKRIPGKKGWEEISYNKLDQVVFTQNVVQRSTTTPSPYRSFIKYDGLGRVIMTGIESQQTLDRATIQYILDNTAINWETRDNSASNYHGYTYVGIPGNPAVMETDVINYYDNYDIPGIPNNQSTNFSKMTNGLLTAKKVRILGSADLYLWTVNYYNDRAELVKVYQQHSQGGVIAANQYDEINNTYNFSGETTATVRRHYVSGIEKLYARKEFTYDHMGRIKDTKQKTGDNSSTTNAFVLVSRNTYNGIGQLSSKSLHSTNNGTNFAQTIKYRFNPRGWLIAQSAPLFAFELKYETDSVGLTPQYNGNISAQKWGLNTSLSKQYTYSYDKISRLTTAVSQEGNNERIGYDMIGNITRLQRHSAGTLVDQLRYNYSAGRLATVVDSNANTVATYQLPGTTTYAYDSNGSMVERINTASAGNNMYSMSYNHLGLPISINANGALISYTYNGEGNKLKKLVSGSLNLNNEYISGIQYESGILKNLNTDFGRVVRISATNYSYEYSLADHLGNGRLYFDINVGIARKIQETDYYAFGLDLQKIVSGTLNKFQYNGKEKQDQEKMYDYGARFYDPVIGRWNVIDAKSELYFQITPYAYAANTPTNAIDPDGHIVIFINGNFYDGSGGSSRYWRGVEKGSNRYDEFVYRPWSFDKGVMKRFNDHNESLLGTSLNPYIDGSLGGHAPNNGNVNFQNRVDAGYEKGNMDAAVLINSLARTNGVITESLKIVTHSMGSAFGKGYIKAIIEYAKANPELAKGLSITEYDFAAFQQNKQSAIPGVPLYQFDNESDGVVDGLVGRLNGSKHAKQAGREEKGSNDNVSSWGGHSIGDFMKAISTLTEGTYKFIDGKFVKQIL